MTSEPEIQSVNLASLDQYLVLASDGLYSRKFGKKDVYEFIIKSIKEGKNKNTITEELVEKAISCGSPDNVTVIMVNLGDLYENHQRSTPYQTSTLTMSHKFPSVGSQDYDARSESLKPIFHRTTTSVRDDMEIDNNVSSPFSGPSTLASSSWLKSGTLTQNQTQGLSSKDLALRANQTYPLPEMTRPGRTSLDSSLMPKPPVGSFQKNRSTNLRRINREKTFSKKNKDSGSFLF